MGSKSSLERQGDKKTPRGNASRTYQSTRAGPAATFLSSLLDALADRPFVQSVDLETKAIVVKGRDVGPVNSGGTQSVEYL